MDLFITTNTDEGKQISFQDSCTIENASELKKALLEEFPPGQKLILDFSSVATVDLSFFQLLSAVSHTCSSQGIDIQCRNISNSIAQLLERIGFSADCITTCFS